MLVFRFYSDFRLFSLTPLKISLEISSIKGISLDFMIDSDFQEKSLDHFRLFHWT